MRPWMKLSTKWRHLVLSSAFWIVQLMVVFHRWPICHEQHCSNATSTEGCMLPVEILRRACRRFTVTKGSITKFLMERKIQIPLFYGFGSAPQQKLYIPLPLLDGEVNRSTPSATFIIKSESLGTSRQQEKTKGRESGNTTACSNFVEITQVLFLRFSLVFQSLVVLLLWIINYRRGLFCLSYCNTAFCLLHHHHKTSTWLLNIKMSFLLLH
jgi:hypothetical protein